MAKNKPETNTSTSAAQKASTSEKQQAAPKNASTATTAQQVTPKAKKSNKKSDKPNIFKRMWKGIKGIFSELKKVTWPKGKEVGNNTAVVLVVVVLFFIILFAIDYVLSGILGLVTNGEWTTIFIK